MEPGQDSEWCKYAYVVDQLYYGQRISRNGVLFQQAKDKEYDALLGSMRTLAGRTTPDCVKERLAGRKWDSISRKELELILKDEGLNLGLDDEQTDVNPPAVRGSWKLHHGVSFVFHLLFAACFVLAVYAVVTGADQGLLEKYVEPMLSRLWDKLVQQNITGTVHSKFRKEISSVRQQLEEIDKRLDAQEQRFNASLAAQEQQFNASLAAQKQQFNASLAAQGQHVSALVDLVTTVGTQVLQVHKRLNESKQDVRELMAEIETCNANLSVIKANVSVIEADLHRTNESVGVLQTVVQARVEDMQDLGENMSSLSERLKRLEEEEDRSSSGVSLYPDWLDNIGRLFPNCSETFLFRAKMIMYVSVPGNSLLTKLVRFMPKRWVCFAKWLLFIRSCMRLAMFLVCAIVVCAHSTGLWNLATAIWNSATTIWTYVCWLMSILAFLHKMRNLGVW